MSLNLDLGESTAKVDRAFEHLGVLEREIPASFAQDDPYTIRFDPIDQQTGWCDVVLVPDKTPRSLLGVLLGDVVHNLRCALDYIVTALAGASNTPLTRQHQFPTYTDPQRYRTKVGTTQGADPSGPLRGITVGLAEIEQLQPYHHQSDPRNDPLWHLNQFSNADKHRQITNFLAVPGGSLRVFGEGNVNLIQKSPVPQIQNWSPDQEYVICRLHFAAPYPSNLRTAGPVRVGTGFRTVPFAGEPEHAAHIAEVHVTCDHVRMIVNRFKQI